MIYDVLIIGAGPAGLSAALMLGRACRAVMVLDAGEPRNHAARQVNGYLGVEGARPQEHRHRGLQQLARYDVECVLDRAVLAESVPDSGLPTLFRVQGESGQTRLARKLLFATGVRDHLPQIPGLQDCYGLSVHHCPYCDGWEHREQRLAALGARVESTRDLAQLLMGWSNRIILLTNGERLCAADRDDCDRLGIQWEEQKLLRLVHDEGKLRQIAFSDETTLDCDALFFSSGSEPASDLPRKLGCEIKEKGQVETSSKQHTCVAGVFLAGDADGDVQFAIVAAGEGATAATAINQELSDENRKATARNAFDARRTETVRQYLAEGGDGNS